MSLVDVPLREILSLWADLTAMQVAPDGSAPLEVAPHRLGFWSPQPQRSCVTAARERAAQRALAEILALFEEERDAWVTVNGQPLDVWARAAKPAALYLVQVEPRAPRGSDRAKRG